MAELTSIAVVTLVVVLAALGGMTLVRHYVPRARLSQHTDVTGYIYAVIGVIYGVILAQVVVAAWEEYRDARDVAGAEASAVLDLGRLATTWPEEDQARIRTVLVRYAREVIEDEWPAMASGDFAGIRDQGRLDRVWAAYDPIARGSLGSSASFAASLEQLDALDDARRARFQLAARTLPPTMTFILVLGGVVTVGFSYLFAVDDRVVHGLITASLAMLVALLLLLTYQLETPFSGVDAIDPAAMQMVLQSLEERR